MKKEVVCILLAGGMGTRLKELTDTISKPALHFGGKYRMIDFVLSNCSNSGFDTLGIITQYEPIELMSYIGSGSAWDLDVLEGGVSVLPPYTSKKEGFYWQNGTARAVYQHLNFIDLYEPKYVIILSTDHIYKMDYNKVLSYHISKEADLTISCVKVNKEDAKRLGVVSVNDHYQITSFTEKPSQTEACLASQGIYIFNYPLLKDILNLLKKEDEQEMDFAKHVIPYMINKHQVYAYPFKGYWKDIGTIESLWQANMDLIDYPEYMDLYNRRWPIFSTSEFMPPHHVYQNASISQSLVCEGSFILGSIKHSVLSGAVLIEEDSTIINSIMMPNVKIGKNCFIKNAIIKMGVTVPDGTIIGDDEITLVTEEVVRS